MVTIYHNPRCNTSRNALRMLRDRGIEPTIIEYLKTPPDAATLDGLLKTLKMEPRELMRKKEAPYKALKLDDPKKTRDQLIRAMVTNPILIERPIAVNRGKVALGRPAEKVLDVL